MQVNLKRKVPRHTGFKLSCHVLTNLADSRLLRFEDNQEIPHLVRVTAPQMFLSSYSIWEQLGEVAIESHHLLGRDGHLLTTGPHTIYPAGPCPVLPAYRLPRAVCGCIVFFFEVFSLRGKEKISIFFLSKTGVLFLFQKGRKGGTRRK